MDYKTQYQMYLSQASAALEDACAKFLPEESEVCRAARSPLLPQGIRGGNGHAGRRCAPDRSL